MNSTNITKPYKGLHTDNSPVDQPKDTYRFGLNGVRENEIGDENFSANEESNSPCGILPEGYFPIGKVYIGNGETAIFLVSPSENLSEIGILDDKCLYTTHVNANLGFKINHQIDAVYRLRRGCERTIYWVDGLNKPRIFNFDKPYNFKDSNDNWDIDKFNLQKIYSKIPILSRVEITEEGNLKSGSYNFAIQYLDEDLNPTEFITTTDTIIIYNDNTTSKSFSEIRGSTNKITDYQNFGITNKAIKLYLSNLDTDYLFYRVAIIEANNGSGEVSSVFYSSEISTKINTWTYTGTEGFEKGTEEEVKIFNFIIDNADHIEQLENTLILSNTKGKQVDWCKLQKYASRIKSAVVMKKIILNDINIIDNQKRGQVHTECVGYMPGEIYSFGVVYVFKDGYISPVYHIPGQNLTTYIPKIFDTDGNLVQAPMSIDNTLTDTVYQSNSNCSAEDYWGVDCQGTPLAGTNVRHHRFPLRSEVDKPLLVKNGSFSNPVNFVLNGLLLNITGTILSSYVIDTITYLVSYEINGSMYQVQGTVDKTSYSSITGILDILIATSLSDITNITVQELDYNTNLFVTPYSGLTYTTRVEIVENTSTSTTDDSIYTSEIFGIKFFEIEIPKAEDIGGEEIVGYYIVRNERTEEQKTILDTGVLTHLIEETGATTGEVKFIAHGHLIPNTPRIKNNIFGLIHPEHRFSNKKYSNTTKLIKQGKYVVNSINKESEVIEDAQPGTSYDASIHKRRERDTDGFSLHCFNRNNNIDYQKEFGDFAINSEIKDVFYLDSLFSKTITDFDGTTRKEVYNLSADNKIGFTQLNKEVVFANELPYVVMKRDLENPYANFRVLPFYKETDNMSPRIGNNLNETVIFNGDTYISPMKYMSSMLYDVRIKDRKRKSGLINFILGGLAILAGILIAVGTLGLGTAASIAAIGFGISQISVGLKREQMNKVYGDLYEQGLRDTVDDSDTTAVFGPNPPDDTIQWFHETLTNVWFESTANMNWRMGATIGVTDFLNSPTGYNKKQTLQYCIDKLTIADTENDDGRMYQGYAKAEIYEINPDYRRRDKQKVFFHLGLEYDCCSKCKETFPHRTHVSERSFSEELTDNFRIFLPNNYIDIEGYTGVITDIFTIQNNLYIHTEEALWHLPQNIQERITGEIVSFIGTGDYFSIPPRKIVDDMVGISAGCHHKWATIKTPFGVFFVSEKLAVIYQFNGNNLHPISSMGMYNWFKNNTLLELNKYYYILNNKNYPYYNNPSNKYGIGFISTYDSRYERVIFTKKDFYFGEIITQGGDFEICAEGGELIVFNNISTTIQTEVDAGWEYVGIEDCRLKFQRLTTEIKDVTTFEVNTIPNNADIVIQLDMSGSFNSITRAQIKDAATNWVNNFSGANPNWNGNLYFCEVPNGTTLESQKCWKTLNFILNNQGLMDINGNPIAPGTINPDIIAVSFVNENEFLIGAGANNSYHNAGISDPLLDGLSGFYIDYNQSIIDYNTHIANGGTFKALIYPIVYTHAFQAETNGFLQHCMAALKGVSYTAAEFNSLPINPFCSNWNLLGTSLQGVNPYPDNGLENYGWKGKFNRGWDGLGVVITPEQFQIDMNEFLQGVQDIEIVVIQVEFPKMEYKYIDGVVFNNPQIINNAWTISYSLKSNPNSWQYWHSYLPNFYLHTPEKHYSWIYESPYNTFWLHNKLYNYQTYYGKKYPYIIEFVSVSNPLSNKIFDYIEFITEAKKYKIDTNEYLDIKNITFDKMVAYNSRQITGVLNLFVKEIKGSPETYLQQQITNLQNNDVLIDKNEGTWALNDLRDIRIDYEIPMFNKNINSLQEDYYIDKIVNTSAINYNKDWTQLESLRDKYLIIRFIFSNFDDVKLLSKFFLEHETLSKR